jgi:hypothetical protein
MKYLMIILQAAATIAVIEKERTYGSPDRPQ